MRLHGETRSINTLSADDVRDMYALMRECYDNVSQTKFERDLYAKDGVVMLRGSGSGVRGFSSYVLSDTVFRGRRFRILFSGDTVVAPKDWGQWTLFKSFANMASALLSGGEGTCYWFLLTKGIRTYLLLPLFFKHFYPHATLETPELQGELLHHLAAERFGPDYVRDEGIVKLNPPADRLKPELARVTGARLSNPHARHFLARNPGYTHGNELASIAELSRANLTPAANKFFKGADLG